MLEASYEKFLNLIAIGKCMEANEKLKNVFYFVFIIFFLFFIYLIFKFFPHSTGITCPSSVRLIMCKLCL